MGQEAEAEAEAEEAAEAMAVPCRLQFLEDGEPFSGAAFPEPRRPPVLPVDPARTLAAQMPLLHRRLLAPLPLEDCALQVLPSGHYLDLEQSLLEQKDELEGFFEDVSKGRRPILLLRTQLSVRVQAILDKLYTAKGPELRRSLFSLKQLFQEDKDLVPEFVSLGGLTCLIAVGAEADQNYQNYILRALSQIMLFVDGMMGVIGHNATVQWLYTLCGSLYRLVVKTALKLLLVFVEYTESNGRLLIQAIAAAEQARGSLPWSPLVAILEPDSGSDSELQVFAMTLINKTLAALPDQDSFYDVTDCLEQQGMERIVAQHMAGKGTDPGLRHQLAIYESSLRYEDGLEETPEGPPGKERRKGEEGGRRGPRRSLGYTSAVAASAVESGSSQHPPVAAKVEKEEMPTAHSSVSCVSGLQLSSLLVGPVEGGGGGGGGGGSGGETPTSLGERSVFKLRESASAWPEEGATPAAVGGDRPVLKRFEARFLENLAASQKEKLFAISQGRAEVLAEAVPGPEQLGPGRWSEGAAQSADQEEPRALPVVGPCDPKEAEEEPPPASRGPPPLDTPAPPEEKGPQCHHQPHSPPWAAEERRGAPPEEEGRAPEAEGAQLPAVRALRAQFSLEAESSLQSLERTLLGPFRKDAGGPSGPPPLKIRDLDFSDLGEDEDVIEEEEEEEEEGMIPSWAAAGLTGPPPPPPPPLPGCPPPPPPPPLLPPAPPPLTPGQDPPSPAATTTAKKKTVKLFWKEIKGPEGQGGGGRFGAATLWASLEAVEVDAAKLGHLFESKAKESLGTKKAADGKKLLVVLDPKRSNAINIGLTVLPPVHIIKQAILNFDEFAITKEGIEKILTMVPTEEERQRIEEAQLGSPDLPLGSAEQFLLALSSVAELQARLQLWAFKLDYDAMEQEIAEPLYDLKLGMEQLAQNRTFKCILATLLAMGNFLNGSQSRGFELSYLSKVSEVKDTVHRQTLLHHLCHFVVEKFPDSTDLYSEIPALTRSAKVDFEGLAEGLLQLEQRCRAAWESLKAVAKHDLKPALKAKLTDFLQAATQKVVILKVVHRRVLNRFRSFLRFLGYDGRSAQELSATGFCRTLREFALEFRTCHERVLQQRKKRAAHRERSKTRGRMITEMERFSAAHKAEEGPPPAVLSAGLQQKDEAEHQSMASILIAPSEPSGRRSRGSRGFSKPSPPSAAPARPQEGEGEPPHRAAPAGCPSENEEEEIMDRLVKSVTQSSPPRPGAGKERKRSRLNRKSLRRTLKNGLSDELVQALGLAKAAGVAV